VSPADPPPSDDAARHHPHCHRCGYDLHGLSETGRCPECGAAYVALSGFALLLSNPQHQRLALRMSWLLAVSTVAAGWIPLAIVLAVFTNLTTYRSTSPLAREMPTLIVATSFAAYVVARMALEYTTHRFARVIAPSTPAELRPSRSFVAWTWAAHVFVALALATIVIAPMDYARRYHVSDVTYRMTGLMIAIGGGLLVISLTTWRSTLVWRQWTLIAHLVASKPAARRARIVTLVKPTIEAIWLILCWLPFAFAAAMLRHLHDTTTGVAFFSTIAYVFFWLLKMSVWLEVHDRLNSASRRYLRKG
jgi:hypothetical protein